MKPTARGSGNLARHRSHPGTTVSGPAAVSAHDRTADLKRVNGVLDLPLPVRQQLLDYLGLLRQWNQVYNLSAIRDPDQMLVQHLLDCLAVVPALDRWCEQERRTPSGGDQALRVLDVGSGGGLPGVVLAIVRPAWRVDCVDTVGKKASFIQQVAAQLGLPRLRGLHARVESLQPPPRYDLITSRAFASLLDFTRLSAHLLAPGGAWAALKGRDPDDERAALGAGVEVFHVERLAVPGLDAQRCLVWMQPAAADADDAGLTPRPT